MRAQKSKFSKNNRLVLFLLSLAFFFVNSLFGQNPIQKALSRQASQTSTFLPVKCIEFSPSPNFGGWDSLHLDEFTYLPDGKPSSQIRKQYNGSGWVNFEKDTWQYNAAGLKRSTEKSFWVSNQWRPSRRIDFQYDLNGNVTLETELLYNGSSYDSSLQKRVTYIYDSGGRIVEQRNAARNVASSPNWQNTDRFQYTFDQNFEWDTIVISNWNVNNWLESTRFVDLTFHDFEKNLPLQALIQNYNNGVWENLQRFKVDYFLFDSQDWLFENFTTTWDTTFREIFNFDNNGNLIFHEQYNWNGAWSLASGYVAGYQYDNQARPFEIVEENWNGTTYSPTSKRVYVDFFTSNGGIGEELQQEAKLWPNPVLNTLNISMHKETNSMLHFRLIDAFGKIHFETYLNGGSTEFQLQIPDDLPNGIYFGQMKAKDRSFSRRIVVNR